MTQCPHVDLTTVQQFETRKGKKIAVLECENCGRVFQTVDNRITSNFPNVSYYQHLSA